MMRDSLKYDIKLDPLKYLFFVCLLLFTLNVYPQEPDTVVVYEYVHITDTVWLDPKPGHDTLLLEKLNPVGEATLILHAEDKKAELKIISTNECATIPVTNIILSDNNKNLNSMKRLTFLGLTFLAVNSSLFAQERIEKSIGFHIGSNSVFQPRFYPAIDWYKYNQVNKIVSAFEISPSIGIKGNLPIGSTLSVSSSLNYLQICGLENDHSMGLQVINGIEYNIISMGDAPNSDLQKNGYTNIIKLYSESPTSKFHLLSTDFLLNYYFLKGTKVDGRFYGGLRVDIVLAQTINSGYSDKVNTEHQNVIFNYEGGLGFDFRKKYYLEVEYSGNINRFVDTSNLKVNYYTASVNLGYYLFRQKEGEKNHL